MENNLDPLKSDAPEQEIEKGLAEGDPKEIVKSIPPEVLLSELAKLINPDRSKQTSHRVERRIEQHFSGPIPPPHILAKYDEISGGGFANRIVTMAESEQGHRHDIEKTMVRSAISSESRGQNFAFLLCLAIIAVSFVMIFVGKEVIGSIFAGSTMIGLAYVFITGKKPKNDDEAPE